MVSLQPQEWSTQADPATGEETHGALGCITGSMRRELRNGLRAVLPPNGRHFFLEAAPAPITVARPGIRTDPPSMNWNGVLAQNTPDTLPHHPWAAKAVRIIDLAEAGKW